MWMVCLLKALKSHASIWYVIDLAVLARYNITLDKNKNYKFMNEKICCSSASGATKCPYICKSKQCFSVNKIIPTSASYSKAKTFILLSIVLRFLLKAICFFLTFRIRKTISFTLKLQVKEKETSLKVKK